MCKLRQIFKLLLPGILVLVSASVFAQEDKLSRAQQLYKTEPDIALLTIDSVIVHPLTQNDFTSWTLRAFIYYELYKRSDRQKLNSSLRDSIVSSIKVSNRLNPDSLSESSNKKLLKTIWAGYYNIGKSLLHDSINYQRSQQAYNKFKEIYLLYDPAATFDAKDVEYYLAVGSVYSDIFTRDNNNTEAGETAKLAFLKVLDIQRDNQAANVGMGLMYYNQAVNLSKSLDYGAGFEQIDIVQENMIKLAKQAEQFITKAYNKDNGNLKAIEALYYIYRMLNELQKSEEFKKKGEEKGIKFDGEEKKEGEKQENKDNQQNKEK